MGKPQASTFIPLDDDNYYQWLIQQAGAPAEAIDLFRRYTRFRVPGLISDRDSMQFYRRGRTPGRID
ncbi:hypothetical protein KAR91_40270 [Candidatus Pacearchaeota archaeon]|nr:hypothetical protein [Candidatus Pacearchaeota archaeon]